MSRRGVAAIFTHAGRVVARWLHASRHRRVSERLRRLGRPRNILVVCEGNVCRSPFMAAVLTRLLPDVAITSAGFARTGRPVPDHGMTVAASKGLDLSPHRSSRVTRAMIDSADLVVVMDTRQATHIERAVPASSRRIIIAGDLDPVGGEGRAIRDPWRQPLDAFERSYARLERCATVLARELTGPPPR